MAIDQDLARTMLTEAASRYESACRWSLVLYATIFVFHLLTFSPFIRAQAERFALAEQTDLLNRTSTRVADMLDAQEAAMKAVNADLDAMLKRKKTAFELLQRAVETMRLTRGPDGDPERRDAPPVQRPMVQMQVQRSGPQITESARVGFFIETIRQENLTEKVRSTNSGRVLREVLRPIVEREIIEPQFEIVRQAWQERLPGLREKVETTRALFARLSARFPQEKRWPDLRDRTDTYLTALDKVSFGPPDDPEWWHSVVGKDDAVLEMKKVAVDRLRTPSLRDAIGMLQALLDERKQLVADIDARLKALEEQFEAQKERLAGLVAPIQGVALDLSVVSANFPLVLALLLAAAMVWPVRRYASLRDAAALASRAGLIDEPAADALLRPRGRMRTTALLIGQAVLASAWCLLAAWQLAAWPGREGLDLMLLTALAVVIAVGTALYKAQVLRGTAARATYN